MGLRMYQLSVFFDRFVVRVVSIPAHNGEKITNDCLSDILEEVREVSSN